MSTEKTMFKLGMCPVDPRCSSTPQRFVPVLKMVVGDPSKKEYPIPFFVFSVLFCG